VSARVRSGLAALAIVLAGCNAAMMAPDDGGLVGDDSGSAGDGGFVTAPHLPFPQVTLHTTPVLSSAQLVTITYMDMALRSKVEQFGDFVINSQWYATVGTEYGVGPATHLSKVELGTNAPGSTTDAMVVAFLKQQAMAGMIPAPSATNNQLVYLMYFPPTTKIDDGTGAILCQGGYAGYHSNDTLNGVPFVYAILPDCNGNLDDLTSTVAHELIESATDPSDGWYLDVPKTNHWLGANGDEVGDLCQDDANVSESGWALQRSWSNAAALAGASPCVPIPDGEIFADITPTPTDVVTLPAGSSTTFTITGWTTGPTVDWKPAYSVGDSADFDPMAMIQMGTINNGTSLTVTLSVPAGTAAGKVGSAQIYAGMTSGNFWPVTVVVK
jgi:hypothetical protein